MNARQRKKTERRAALPLRDEHVAEWALRRVLAESLGEVIRRLQSGENVGHAPFYRRARQLTQGRRVVQAALIASIPRTRPAIWLSDERVAASGIDPRCLHGLPRNNFLQSTLVPPRLAWQVRLLTPDFNLRMRQQRRASEERRRERRLALSALPLLEFTVSHDRSRMSF